MPPVLLSKDVMSILPTSLALALALMSVPGEDSSGNPGDDGAGAAKEASVKEADALAAAAPGDVSPSAADAVDASTSGVDAPAADVGASSGMALQGPSSKAGEKREPASASGAAGVDAKPGAARTPDVPVEMVVGRSERKAGSVSVKGTGDATVALLTGLDTNARRVIGEQEVTDAFASLSGQARGALLIGSSHYLHGRYDIGLKKFFDLDSEDLIVQRLEVGYSPSFGRWTISLDGRGKLRNSRDGVRDYRDLDAELSARRTLPRGFSLRAEGGFRDFNYPHQEAYGFKSVYAGLGGSWRIHRTVVASLDVSGALPEYEGHARASDASYDDERYRNDKSLSVQAKVAWRGPVALQVGYLWVGNWSNSYGESFQRHRVFLGCAARLPWSVFLGVHLAWQTLHYPDGLFLSDDLVDLMLYDDESQSSSTLKLSRPLNQYLELELKYKLSWVDLPRRYDDASLNYVRHVGTLGLVGRF